MNELLDEQLEQFKLHLNSQVQEGFEPIPISQLEQADRTCIVQKMKDSYDTEGSFKITYAILKKMNMKDLSKKLKNVMNIGKIHDTSVFPIISVSVKDDTPSRKSVYSSSKPSKT